jgi:hypothetical protein
MPPQTLPDVVQQLGLRQRWVSETTSQYSSEVQQCPRYSTLSSGVRPHSTRLNNAEREPCLHFASKGLGVRVPLAPPISPCQAYFQHSLAIRTQSTCSNKLQQLALSSGWPSALIASVVLQFGLLARTRPLAFATFIHLRVRSRIRSDSNSATIADTLNSSSSP